MDGLVPWTDQVREDLHLPDEVTTREEAIEHLLCKAAELRPGGPGLFLLGRYYLPKDCGRSVHFLARYLAEGDRRDSQLDGVAEELLQVVEREGCDAAHEWLRAQAWK
jgi:hypothetical protein